MAGFKYGKFTADQHICKPPGDGACGEHWTWPGLCGRGGMANTLLHTVRILAGGFAELERRLVGLEFRLVGVLWLPELLLRANEAPWFLKELEPVLLANATPTLILFERGRFLACISLASLPVIGSTISCNCSVSFAPTSAELEGSVE